jgi:copper homeostasis protein
MLLEVCAYNIQSCVVAQEQGAGRIELCAEPLQGGTTPSYGFIRKALDTVSIPVFPIIRPRGGDFCYDDAEMDIIREDILMCRQMGCEGISTGVAIADGRIDVAKMKLIREWASPMQITCHKVFDAAPDIFEALESLIEAGCDRVLTSGGSPTATAGMDAIIRLVAQSAGRIRIMPGGSVRPENLEALRIRTGAKEFHSSGITVQNEQNRADPVAIRKMTDLLQR